MSKPFIFHILGKLKWGGQGGIEDQPKQFDRGLFLQIFTENVGFSGFLGFFSFFLVCFGLLRNSSVCFGCFDIGSKHRNKPKFFVFGFTKQMRNRSCFGLFRFEPKFIFVCFEDTLP